MLKKWRKRESEMVASHLARVVVGVRQLLLPRVHKRQAKEVADGAHDLRGVGVHRFGRQHQQTVATEVAHQLPHPFAHTVMGAGVAITLIAPNVICVVLDVRLVRAWKFNGL